MASDKEQLSKQEHKKFHPSPIIYRNGLLAGILMAAFLILVQVAQTDHSPWLKFVKYFILAAFLGLALKKTKNDHAPLTFFKRGIQLTIGISLVAGITLVLINSLLYFLAPEMTFNKFTLEAENVGELLILNVALLFEVFVYGMILGFIFLQLLKYQDPKGEKAL